MIKTFKILSLVVFVFSVTACVTEKPNVPLNNNVEEYKDIYWQENTVTDTENTNSDENLPVFEGDAAHPNKVDIIEE